MFALGESPPDELEVTGEKYALVRVFKHDFFAATCLYEAVSAVRYPRIVVKLYRTQQFFGLSMLWAGRFMRNHERDIYRALKGVRGIPGFVDVVGPAGLAVEYIDAKPLDHFSDSPGKGFFDRLRRLMDDIHARGVGYLDANKRSNILVTDSGEPFLVDYQISIRRRDDWPTPLRQIVARCVKYVQQCDIYHIYKHKRRLSPGELTGEEEQLSRRRRKLHSLQRKIFTPARVVRRMFLSHQHSKGRLISPTESLEDHHQPEKATWRKDGNS